MTTVRQIPMSESEAMWAESQRRWETRGDHTEALECYGRYGDEGHLVVLTWVRDPDPGEGWTVHCAGCKENAWGLTPDEIRAVAESDWHGGSAKPRPYLLNFGQARWWADDHRADHHLERQKYCPAMNLYGAQEAIEEDNN